MHKELPVIPVEEKIQMDVYNVELRAYQDDIGQSLSYHHMNLAHMMSHMHIPPMDNAPENLQIRSWDERWQSRQGGSGGSGYGGGGEEEDED